MKCYIAEENKSLIKSPQPLTGRDELLFHDISLAHINLLHEGGAELVQLFVERLLLALIKGCIRATMLF